MFAVAFPQRCHVFPQCFHLRILKISSCEQIKYTKDFPHIAPGIVTGKKGQSIESDIYSFGKMTDVIFLKANLGSLHEVLRQTLDVDPKKRPTLQEILKQLLKSEAPVRKLPH